jgi:hypothetical protein
VQKILGHGRLQTTAIYLNFTDVHIQEEFGRKWKRHGLPRVAEVVPCDDRP